MANHLHCINDRKSLCSTYASWNCNLTARLEPQLSHNVPDANQQRTYLIINNLCHWYWPGREYEATRNILSWSLSEPLPQSGPLRKFSFSKKKFEFCIIFSHLPSSIKINHRSNIESIVCYLVSLWLPVSNVSFVLANERVSVFWAVFQRNSFCDRSRCFEIILSISSIDRHRSTDCSFENSPEIQESKYEPVDVPAPNLCHRYHIISNQPMSLFRDIGSPSRSTSSHLDAAGYNLIAIKESSFRFHNSRKCGRLRWKWL